MRRAGLLFFSLVVFGVMSFAQDIGAAYFDSDKDVIYLFDKSGKNFIIFDGENEAWHDWRDVSGFADGKGRLASISDTLYDKDNDLVYVFDGTGASYKVWDNRNEEWTDTRYLSSFGNGKCPFRTIGACFYDIASRSFYFFNPEGNSFTVWNSEKQTWSAPKATSNLFNNKSSLSTVGAAFCIEDGEQIVLFSADGREFATYDVAAKTWQAPVATASFAGGTMPKLRVAAAPATPVPTTPAQVQPQPTAQAQASAQPVAKELTTDEKIEALISQLEALKTPSTTTSKPGAPYKETMVAGSAKEDPPQQGVDASGAPVTYKRKTAMYEASATFDKSVLLNPGTDVIYPGSVVLGESLDDGTYVEYTRGKKRPVTVSYDITGSTGSVSETIVPSLSNFRNVHNKILGQITGGVSTNFTFEEIKVNDETDFSIKFNAGVSYSSPAVEASVKGGFDWAKGDKKNKYIVKFMQTFYTVDIDQGQNVFLFEDFKLKDFKGYRPVYVSSVAYGRLAYLSVESTETWQKIKTTLEGAVEAKLSNVKFDASLETEYNQLKQNTSINITSIGSSKVATGIDSFMSMLTEDGFSKNNPGKIVSYKLRFVDDNSIANIKFAGSYPITSTEAVVGKGFEVKVELTQFNSQVEDGAGSTAEFYGDFGVFLRESGADANKGSLWTYTEGRTCNVGERSNNGRSEVSTFTVPSLRSRMLVLKGRGLREDDSSGDDQFNDIDHQVALDSFSTTPQVLNLRGTYKKGASEYMEFVVKVTATPIY